MDITRREFLGYTAGGTISVMGLPLPESTPTANRLRKLDKWRLFGTTGRPSIPESALGYHAAIPVERQRFEPWERTAVSSCSLLIYPSLPVINQTQRPDIQPGRLDGNNGTVCDLQGAFAFSTISCPDVENNIIITACHIAHRA